MYPPITNKIKIPAAFPNALSQVYSFIHFLLQIKHLYKIHINSLCNASASIVQYTPE